MRTVSDRRAAATLAFDRLAPEYDTLVGGEIFQLLRHRTQRAFARRFQPGSRVLEIGCGTGIDTSFLASHGIEVIACDPSQEMVSRCLRRLARDGCESRTTVLPCGIQDLAAFLDPLTDSNLHRTFDGIVSNFGALNCVEHLAPLATLARSYLRPGGIVLVTLMSRFCALEALYFLATGRRQLATRRGADGAVAVPVAGIAVPTFYHRITEVDAALGADVRLAAIEGIGVAIPPPFLETRWCQVPASLRGLMTRFDSLVAPLPPFNRVGDHVLLHFVKGNAHA